MMLSGPYLSNIFGVMKKQLNELSQRTVGFYARLAETTIYSEQPRSYDILVTIICNTNNAKVAEAAEVLIDKDISSSYDEILKVNAHIEYLL